MAIKLDNTFTKKHIQKHEFGQIKPFVIFADKILKDKTGSGNDFLGWLDYQ